ncbi:hypothetical protein [Lutibacter sp.]
MKNQLNFNFIILAILSLLLFSTSFQSLHAQKAKKERVRLKAKYIKVMDGEIYLNIKVTARVKKKNIKVSNIDLIIYNNVNNKKIKVGETTTNIDGESKFVFKSLNSIQPDSTDTYNLVILFKGNDTFKKAKKNIVFKDVDIRAKLITKDSTNYINATLIDANKDSLVSNQSLTVQVQRLFQPLFIGEEFIITDENGTILVPIEDGIPGIDGNLTFEVVLNDSDDFGTVKAIVKAPIGVPIVDESTFDQRTMWSPRNKTPLFLLILPNLLIFSIWGLIIYLITNLFKITKS